MSIINTTDILFTVRVASLGLNVSKTEDCSNGPENCSSLDCVSTCANLLILHIFWQLHTYGKMPSLLSSAVSHVKLFATSSANLFCNRLGGIFPVEECMLVDLC